MKTNGRKKLLACLTAVTLMFGLAACSGGTVETTSEGGEQESKSVSSTNGDSGQISIGWINATMSNSFYKVLVDTAKSEAEALGWKFTYIDSQMDTTKELAGFEDMIANGVDMIFVDCVDPLAVVSGVNKALEAGIPVIAVDNTVDANAKVLTTIMSDNIGLGIVTGQWANGQFDKDTPIKALELSGQQGNMGNLKRRTGFWAGLMAERIKAREGVEVSTDEMYQHAQEMEQDLISNGRCYDERTDFEVMMQTFGGFTESGGLECMEDMITAHPDANLLISEDDAMTVGALKAVNNQELGSQILVCSIASGSKAGLEKIKSGEMDVCGQNHPAEVARLSIETGRKILSGEVAADALEENIYTPPIAITADNIDEYYDPDSEF